MAGVKKPAPKKQATLTSFFTPRTTINGLSHTPKPAVTSSPPQEETSETPRKRPLEEDTDNGNEIPDRSSKRSKGGAAEDDQSTSFHTDSPKTTAAAPTSSARTGRYAYEAGCSDSQAPREEDEEDDAAMKRRKDELHRKFVKKLGHPDSMSLLRRRNHSNDDASPALDGDDADGTEDPEEDEPPTSAKTRKKGSKKGKLTPMEIQFLDIKRKHMDTVLIIEVGYKFRFFGEDARIAAKELSIVCIPGKFRYDERKCQLY